jgi:hypothetical protein
MKMAMALDVSANAVPEGIPREAAFDVWQH